MNVHPPSAEALFVFSFRHLVGTIIITTKTYYRIAVSLMWNTNISRNAKRRYIFVFLVKTKRHECGLAIYIYVARPKDERNISQIYVAQHPRLRIDRTIFGIESDCMMMVAGSTRALIVREKPMDD